MPDQQDGDEAEMGDPFASMIETELDAAGRAEDRVTRVWHLNRAAEYATLSERWRSDRPMISRDAPTPPHRSAAR